MKRAKATKRRKATKRKTPKRSTRKKAVKRKAPKRKTTKRAKRKTTRRKTAKMGRPARLWTAKELADILDDTGKGASLTYLARKHACARSSMHRLTCRADFSDAYRGARGGSVTHAEMTLLAEGLGGRPIVKRVVEIDAKGGRKTTTTTETAGPHVGALGRYLAAYGGDRWSNKIEIADRGALLAAVSKALDLDNDKLRMAALEKLTIAAGTIDE